MAVSIAAGRSACDAVEDGLLGPPLESARATAPNPSGTRYRFFLYQGRACTGSIAEHSNPLCYDIQAVATRVTDGNFVVPCSRSLAPDRR